MLPSLPAALEPPAPFPLVLAQSQSTEFVAPGVRRATYRMQTSDGPLVVNVVAVDPHEPTVRFDAVVANDRLISAGETISAMARRTGAVAGVNADYFDIGNTNQPLNAVVRDGALLRTPSNRIVLDVRADRSIHYDRVGFTGRLRYGANTVPLTAINEWPPQGGAAYLSSAYGLMKAAPGVDVAEIVPADSAHDATRVAGTYRVASVGAATPGPVRGTLLAFGPAARALAPLPVAGDTVSVDVTTDPPLDAMLCAVGGGPLLLASAAPVDDPNTPAPEERDRRFPVSGAASTRGGTLLLASVDGRGPSTSIGVTRPQFAALLLALGATDGMAFDSGGSATLVARVLGDPAASVLNAPSDGEERPVADGFFVYSTAAIGPPSQLVVRPSAIVALPHAVVPLRAALVDAAGHALGPAHLEGGDAIRAGTASRRVTVRAAGLAATLPVDVVEKLRDLDVVPDVRNPDPGALVRFRATGTDASGRVVEVGDAVRWSAGGGRFIAPGVYRAPASDANIVATAGGVRAETTLRVGRRHVALAAFDAAHAAAWRFAALPSGTAGGARLDPSVRELTLDYDFSSGARAAYANATVPLPGEPLTFAIEIAGDGSGVGVRAAFVNRFGERRALTLARSLDWTGWQTRSVALPNDLSPPVALVSLYAVDTLGRGRTTAAGTLVFRNPSVVVMGTP